MVVMYMQAAETCHISPGIATRVGEPYEANGHIYIVEHGRMCIALSLSPPGQDLSDFWELVNELVENAGLQPGG